MPTRPTSGGITGGGGGGTSGITQAQADARYPGPSVAVYVATAATQASVQAANSAAHTAGGGTVMLPDAGATGIVVTTVGFTLYEGVAWVGVPPRFYGSATSGVIDSGIAFTGGTWFTSSSGISYIGGTSGFKPIYGASGTTPASFPCFWDGATNSATQPTTAQYGATSTIGIRMSDIGIAGFSIGVSTGAQNVSGATYSDFRNLYIEGCSTWGFYHVNPQHTKLYGIHCFGNGNADGVSGNFYSIAWVNGGVYQPGNCLYEDIYGFTQASSVVTNSHLNRGIVIGALCPDTSTYASLNEIYATRVQQNSFSRTGTSQAATTVASQTFTCTGSTTAITLSGANTAFPVGTPVLVSTSGTLPGLLAANTTYWVVTSTSGPATLTISATPGGSAISPNTAGTGTQTIKNAGVTITDTTKFALGLPVNFTAAAPTGFAEFQTYFVINIPGSIANTLMLGNTPNDLFPVAATSGTSSTLGSVGYANIELSGLNNGSAVTSTLNDSQVQGIDTEGAAQNGVLVINGSQCIISAGNTPQFANRPDFCLRNSSYCAVIFPGIPTTDYDNNSSSSLHIGNRGTMIQCAGVWMGTDSSLGTTVLNLAPTNKGNKASIIFKQPSGVNFLYPSANPIGVNVFESAATSVALGANTDCLAVGASNSTWTLPIIVNTTAVNSHTGLVYKIRNVGTAIVTMATQSSQAIGIGGNSLTGVSIYPGQCYVFTAQYDGTNLFWAADCLSIYGTVARADLTAQSATIASVAAYTPAVNGTFRIGAYVAITAVGTSPVLTLTVTYTDENSNSKTATMYPSGSLTAGVGTNSTDYSFGDTTIRAKAASAITVVATLTVSTMTFDVGASIEWLR